MILPLHDGRLFIRSRFISMKLKPALLPVVLSLFVLGAGCSFTQTVQVNSNTANQNTNTANTNTTTKAVTYAGQDGKNALELLQVDHQVDVSDQGFVNSIDGILPSDHQYWAFYVNGKLAEVGAKDYATKSNDSIEWKLESF